MTQSKFIFAIFTSCLLLAGIANAFPQVTNAFDDDIGHYFFIDFPFSQVTRTLLELYPQVNNVSNQEVVPGINYTFIDVNDQLYNESKYQFTKGIQQLTFIEWFQYVNYAYRVLSPINEFYMRADNNVKVRCYPHWTGSDYEFKCDPI